MMKQFDLTPSQQAGYDKFLSFYLDPTLTVMVLKGYSGTGKTSLVKRLMADLPQMDAMARLCAPGYVAPEIVLTATTNQAAEAFALAMDYKFEVKTIHSACELRLVTDYKTKEKFLTAYGDGLFRKLVFIDEASFIDQKLLKKLLEQMKECKIVFIGDPAQLTPVEDDFMPAFEMNACEIELTDLVRFEGGLLQELMGNLRAAVMEGNWSKFPLQPGVIERMSRTDFIEEAYRLFTQERDKRVKILAYTNDCVTKFNNLLSQRTLGTTVPLIGQKMLVNEAVNNNASRCTANEEVIIESVEEAFEYGTKGYSIKLLNKGSMYFMPQTRGAKDKAHAVYAREDDYGAMKVILDTWIDLRPSFAQTVNKAQGSTYDIVLVDLDDICSKCRTLEQLARILYVALSRGRSRIIMTGDLRRK